MVTLKATIRICLHTINYLWVTWFSNISLLMSALFSTFVRRWNTQNFVHKYLICIRKGLFNVIVKKYKDIFQNKVYFSIPFLAAILPAIWFWTWFSKMKCWNKTIFGKYIPLFCAITIRSYFSTYTRYMKTKFCISQCPSWSLKQCTGQQKYFLKRLNSKRIYGIKTNYSYHKCQPCKNFLEFPANSLHFAGIALASTKTAIG